MRACDDLGILWGLERSGGGLTHIMPGITCVAGALLRVWWCATIASCQAVDPISKGHRVRGNATSA